MTTATIVSTGAPVRPLFARVIPQDGESFHSILIRACELNVIDRAHKLVALAQIEAAHVIHAPFTMVKSAGPLSVLLSLTEEELLRRMHPRIDRGDGGDDIDWFGAALPRKYIEAFRRSYAPAAAQGSGCHKAIWQVRAIKFDPVTFERLTDECTTCKKTLGWVRTGSLWKCEFCEEPLFAEKAKLIPERLRQAAGQACKIIDPDPAVRADAIRLLPARFHAWNAGDVFQMLVELGEAKTRRSRGLGGIPEHKIGNGDFTDIDAEELAAGYEFIRAWPESFAEYLASSAEIACETPRYRDLFGSLYRHFHPREVYTVVGNELRRERPLALARAGFHGKIRITKELGKEANIISGRAAGSTLGTVWPTIRLIVPTSASVLSNRSDETGDYVIFDREKLIESLAAYQNSRHSADACGQVGVPSYCADQLAECGVIERVTNADAVIMGGGQRRYLLASVDAVQNELSDLALGGERTAGDRGMKLSKALAGRIHPFEWATAINAVRSGEVSVQSVRSAGKIFDRPVVDPRQLNEHLDGLGVLPRYENSSISANAVARALGVAGGVITEAVRKGYLPMNTSEPRNFRIAYEQLAEFHADFMLGGEVRSRLNGRFLKRAKTLADAGLKPVDTLAGTHLWRRADANVLLEACVSN